MVGMEARNWEGTVCRQAVMVMVHGAKVSRDFRSKLESDGTKLMT